VEISASGSNSNSHLRFNDVGETHLNVILTLSSQLLYRVAQNSVNLKHSLVLTGIFRCKPTSQFVERYVTD
jgi:hypothetical protein